MVNVDRRLHDLAEPPIPFPRGLSPKQAMMLRAKHNQGPSQRVKGSNSNHMRMSMLDPPDVHGAVNSIEDEEDEDDSLLDAEGVRYRSNNTSRQRNSSRRPESRPRLDLMSIDIDDMDNERTPFGPGYASPMRESSADRFSNFLDQMDTIEDTPTKRSSKRRRSNFSTPYVQQQTAPTAQMTPTSSARRSSSQRPQAGLFGSQARSQLHGANALTFNASPRSQTPGIITQQDLQTMMGELSTVMSTLKAATTQVLAMGRELAAMREKYDKELKDQQDHVDETFRKLTDANRIAIKEVSSRFSHIIPHYCLYLY